AVIDGDLAGVAFAIDGGQNGERTLEVVIDAVVRLAADPKIRRIHEDVRAGFELGEAVLLIDVVRAGGAAADEVHRQARFVRQYNRLANAGQVVGRFTAPRFPRSGVSRTAGIGHEAR